MSNRSVVWRQLDLPSTVPPASIRAVLVGLAALPGQPRLVLETLAQGGRLAWRIGANDDIALRKAVHVVRTHVPGVIISPTAEAAAEAFAAADDLTTAAQLRISKSRLLPLAEGDLEAVTRSLLGALAQAGRGEVIRVQLVLGARTWPRRAPERDDARKRALETKHAQHGFGCVLRIAAGSGSEARARQLVGAVGAALRGLEVPGVRISLGRVAVKSVVAVSSPFLWPLWLSVNNLVPLLAWPSSDDPEAALPGLPPRHPKPMAAHAVHPRDGAVVGLSTVSLSHGIRRPVGQPIRDVMQHRHVLGPTGVGKSNLLANLILEDIKAGRGVVVIDPKTDLVNDVLARLDASRVNDVVVLDPSSPRPLGINPLAGQDPDLAADAIVAIFHSLFGDGLGPRSTDILHASLLTLARRGDASLVMVPLLLTNPGFRRSATGRLAKADPLGLGAFWAGFESMSAPEREQAIRPLLNKLRQVTLRPSLRAVFGQRTPVFSLTDVFTKNKILLVELGKDRIGPEAAQLLGSIVVSQLWQTALQRTAVPPEQRRPVMVYIDEVQDYLRLPGSLADALAQARGLGMSITAAHQHRDQLSRLLADIEANTATKLYFRLSPKDARDAATAHGQGVLTKDDFQTLPAFQAYAQLLVDGTTAPWVSISTELISGPVRRAHDLQTHSEATYGRSLDEVEADLLALIDRPVTSRGSAPADTASLSPGGEETPSELGRRRPRAATQSSRQEASKAPVEVNLTSEEATS